MGEMTRAMELDDQVDKVISSFKRKGDLNDPSSTGGEDSSTKGQQKP